MVLLKYFKRVDAKKPTKIDIVLPKPDGPLSSLMPSSSVNPTVMPSSWIESADVAVENAMLMASRVTVELGGIKLKTISIHARVHMQTRSHQRMTLENILSAGKRVIIQKYFFKIFVLPLFSKI